MAKRAKTLCCTPESAWEWVEALAEDALAGDQYSTRLLPRVVAHWYAIRALS